MTLAESVEIGSGLVGLLVVIALILLIIWAVKRI